MAVELRQNDSICSNLSLKILRYRKGMEKYELIISIYSPHYGHFCRRILAEKPGGKQRKQRRTDKVYPDPPIS